MKIAGITDGTSNTIAWAEICHGKYTQFGCSAGGCCDWEGAGWWADADYEDSTITSFYPPNIPIPPVYYTTGRWQNAGRVRQWQQHPSHDVDELSSWRCQRRVRRRIGALHQELDQLVELAEHQAHRSPTAQAYRTARSRLGVTPGVWQALSTINGGEVISSDSY